MARKNKWGSWKPTKKWTMKAAMDVKLGDILKMNMEERADLAQFFQTNFMRRYNEAVKKEIMPYGLDKIVKDFEVIESKYGVSIYDKVTQGVKSHYLSDSWYQVPYTANVLNAYISMMQDFFTWKSNSVAGWEKIKNKESGELFGWNMIRQANGRNKRVPKYVMSDSERRTFWKLYHELVKREQNPLLASDAVMPTHYKGIIDSGLADFWRELALNEEGKYDIDLSDNSEAGITKLINIMEASMKNKELTFPEHIEDESDGNGNDPITGTAERGNNDYWGRTF